MKNSPKDKLELRESFQQKEDKKKERSQENKVENNESKAREIAQTSGDYIEIVKKLQSENLWDQSKTETKQKYSSLIKKEDFPTKEAVVWDMLTVLDLYDSQTAEHCADTYRLIRERLERVMARHKVLAEVLRSENVEMEQFYFASLTHDIGKICIPPFIISNSLVKKNWDDLLLELFESGELSEKIKTKLGIKEDESCSKEDLLTKLEEIGLRSKDIVPIKNGLSDYELFCLEEQWNLSGENSLMEIIDQHAKFSEEILTEQGFETTGKLVGQHHHKNDHGISLPNFREIHQNSDLADILHLADIEQALKSKRYYKEEFSELNTILTLKEEAEKGGVGKAITFFWIKDKRDDFLKSTNLGELTEKERISLQTVNNYLEGFLKGSSLREIEEWAHLHLKN